MTEQFNGRAILTGSFVGGIIAELVTQPVCTTKTVYQTSTMTIPETIKKIYQEGKLSAFFRASNPALLSQGFSSCSKIYLYKRVSYELRDHPNINILKPFIGSAAGCLGGLITQPIDVYKTNKQMNGNFNIKTYINLVKTKGYKELYRGYTAGIGKNVSLYFCLFPMNDIFKSKFDDVTQYKHLNNTLAGLVASPIGSLVASPIEYARIKMIANKTNFSVFYRELLKDKKQIYRGYTLTVARGAPHFAIVMGITSYFIG
jgi:hypothetical protein